MWVLGQIRLVVMRVVMTVALRIMAVFVRRDPKLVVFASFTGQNYSDSPRYIYEYLHEHADFQDYHFVWAFKHLQPVIGACEVVRFNSWRYFYLLTKAKYWVFNAKSAPYLHKAKDQVYLQTWHGTPLKHLAHDLTDDGKHYYRSRQSYDQMTRGYDRDSRHWDYLVSPNPFSSKAFASAFAYPQNQMLETGYPRVDRLVDPDAQHVAKLKQEHGLPLDKQIILYAPTWRDDSFSAAGYTFKLQVDFHQWREVLGDDYVVLFKPHYLIANAYSVPADLADFVYPMAASADINDTYLMSDVLVTDYSSVFFDYAILQRPIYFYMYDFEQYQDNLRGFYLRVPEDLPNDITQDEGKLLTMIKQRDFDDARLAQFNQRFNPWSDGHSAEKVVRRVFNEG